MNLFILGAPAEAENDFTYLWVKVNIHSRPYHPLKKKKLQQMISSVSENVQPEIEHDFLSSSLHSYARASSLGEERSGGWSSMQSNMQTGTF